MRPRAAALLTIAVGLTGCGGAADQVARSTPTPTAKTVTGSLTLYSTKGWPDTLQTCDGFGGYSDIHSGAQLKVTDEAGAIVATGSLGVGTLSDYRSVSKVYVDCIFPVTIPNLGPANFYTVTIGNRGGITYSAAHLEAMDNTVNLTLGRS